MTSLTLYGRPGWGSVLIEAQLVWYGIPFTIAEVGDLFVEEAARQRLAEVNPLAQVPTVVDADGELLTESAAITLWLAERTASAELVPAPDAPERAQFLRWLVFLVANVYPTYTYVDDPARFVPDAAARSGFAQTVGDYRARLYAMLDGTAAMPWFLGERFSALDLYVAAMSYWEPGRHWFAAEAPKLLAIARTTETLPKIAHVFERNFGSPTAG
ncbi:MAG: glutathione S-transferase family protein [Pseudomonadota bacterium]